MSKNAVIFDYGFGNVRSVQRAIEHLGVNANIASDYDESLNADYLIVPGVGNFGECMRGLISARGDEIIKERSANARPVLGICVGHQILFEGSMEADNVGGLGIVHGRSELLSAKIVPHMGWNTIDAASADFALMQRFVGEAFYFVHSYAVLNTPEFERNLAVGVNVTDTRHENCEFISSVQSGSVTGVQFHPEKSGETGLNLIESWLNTY